MSPTRRTTRRPLARRRVPGAAALALLLASATACANDVPEANWSTGLLPEPVTTQGVTVVGLWNPAWIAALATGAVVIALIIWAVIFHRKRNKSAELPPQVRYNLPIEMLYTLVPLVMVAVFFFFTARDQDSMLALDEKNPAPVQVKVEAFQWSWRFTTTVAGKATTPVVGKPVSKYQDGPELVLPVNQRVQFKLESPDVIHSFWVPAFLFKRDVIPGIKPEKNTFEITTLDKQGTFAGRCAELCGVDHSRMLFKVKLVSQADFDKYIATQAGSAQ